ncbi:ankyrin repeat domain-containing protein [Burkholderia arboris]|uniref:ankyrin repeat domain-containing protein n=1 Tax=Burkholderia arboris TaxID=488730 RepID=UPI001CA4414B|nr:ankyrin repeat domain-containing protein [Burkholderia arboris]MBY8610631.1 ankyrin repeat domain-containing protein [Burkholderia arboris]
MKYFDQRFSIQVEIRPIQHDEDQSFLLNKTNEGSEMASAERLKAVFGRYVTHPEFLGLELSDPNQRGAVDDTVLHLAARTGAIEDMKVLIDAGGDVNIAGDLGNTPLHQAAMMNQFDSVKFLLKCGAKKHLRNEFDQTPLEVAELNKNAEIIRLLKTLR